MTSPTRAAVRERATRETTIRVSVDLDGSGRSEISTGVGFYDHLLTSFAHHSMIDLDLTATGDLHIDEHHTVEDVALVLGDAISAALGDRAGISRFGDAAVPMDDALASVALDLSGRPYAVLDLTFRGERVGGLSTQLVEHILESLARTLGANLNVRATGRNDHHIAEAIFKALARSMRAAVTIDPRRTGVASTKGVLGMSHGGLVIVDYGAGNLVSIRNALELLGGAPTIATTSADIREASVIVVPGVGASGPAMERLDRHGLADAIRGSVRDGAWYVGICLGMQLLFERSDEDDARMLGLLGGDVVAIADAPRLPHIGWNQLEVQRSHPLMDGVADGAPAYFVHSYVARPADPGIVVTETEHGSRFPSIVVSGRIIGYQPHPERSGDDGLRLLRNMLALTGVVTPVGSGVA